MAETILSHGVINLTGKRFGRLTALSYQGKTRWLCRCDCGRETSVFGQMLRELRAKSCGCFCKEETTRRFTRHGRSHTPEHNTWTNILQRCYDLNYPKRADYGGRGITVCERWQGKEGFANFFAAPCPRPSPKHSVERIDNDGPYSHENCKWATKAEQSRNTRRNKLLTFQGVTACARDWEDRLGFTKGIIINRLRRGWTPERALTTPVPKRAMDSDA